ncbi:TonB-dependent receptor plug domain-containing protein [Pseudaestuariivita rosea]|uniref:TonB-dependent receptor plug domain-containing protein n=1 Tax=Pseudaestuariivita rosea TaxID=2763263 RepID=UPI001ABB4B1A|nr:TonB-dependent receptor [Pseudaestuariivita rosea]
MRYPLAAISAASVCISLANAQDVTELEEIILSANQSETEASRTGATVEVVTQEELEQRGDMRVADYLNTLPGISVGTNGGPGTQTSLRIRGLSDRYIPVLIDGIDVTDPSQQQIQFNFGSLMTSDISRIEVLKGSQSALYGSDAIGGVISITTNRATEEGTVVSLDLEAGSYETYRGSLNISTLTERGELAFTYSRVTTDGFSAADENDGNDEEDGHSASQISFSAAHNLTDTVRIGLSGFYLKSETEFDASGPQDGAHPFNEISSSEQSGIRTFAEIQGREIDHTVSLSYFENDRLIKGDFPDFDPVGQRSSVSYKGYTDISSNLGLSFGGDWTREGGEDVRDQEIGGLFSEVTYAPSADLDLAFSLRHDEHSNFGGFLSARAAVAYQINDDMTLRAIAANGFRAPSPQELYGPFGANDDLDPEESRTFEVGLERRFGAGSFVKGTLFYTEIDELIQFDNGYVQVDGTSRTRGLELSAEHALNDNLQIFGAYTFTDARNPSDERQIRVPENDLVIGLNASFADRWTGQISAQHVANLEDGVDLRDYTVVNGQIGYDFNDNAQVYLRVENIADQEYQTIRGYGQSDRAFYVGLRTSF